MLRTVRGSASVVLAVVAVGCGTGGTANPDAVGSTGGQQLFTQKCGSCHALEAAGTRGNPSINAPDLDAAFRVPREEGFDESSIREVVLAQMRYPVEPMPPADELFPLSKDYSEDDREADLNAIATFVATVAGDEEATAQARSQAGGQDAGDPQTIFSGNCAGCHTFTPADARGTIGPNLDSTGLDVEAIERQIRLGGEGMPPFEGQLSDEQITTLARFIAGG